MDLALILLGMACTVWTTAELAGAAARRSRCAEFGAVDLGTGEEILVTVDRRRRDRRVPFHCVG
jgi:hypothetical protein